MVKGERNPLSLGTRELEVAKAKRDALLAAKDQAEVDRVLGRSQHKLATLQEINDAYLAADWPRQKTREQNLRTLWLVVRCATGSAKVLELSSAIFTGDLADRYQDDVVRRAREKARALGLAGAEAETLEDKAKYSGNRILSQARSVFANEKPFRRLHFPESLEEFRDRDLFKVTRDLAFKPMSKAEVELFGAESKKLRARAVAGDATARGSYLTWLMMRWLGMRNEEVEHCKPGEWMVEKTGRDGQKIQVMRITNYDYYKVKGVGSIRDLPLAPWLLQELRELCGYDADKKTYGREWLISDAHLTERRVITHRAVNDWMGEVYTAALAAGTLPKGIEVRTAYDFRKQAGSALLEQGASIVEVSKWLGHRDVNTTTKWYINLLRELPVLGELSVA